MTGIPNQPVFHFPAFCLYNQLSFLSLPIRKTTNTMAEAAAVEALLGFLLNKLTSPELIGFIGRYVDLETKLVDLRRTAEMIEAALIDAEDKQISRPMELRLEDLQDLAYDLEDVLDDLATKALKRKIKADKRSKFCNLISSPVTAVKRKYTMGSDIKDISRRLDVLCEGKTKFCFEANSGGGASKSSSPTTYDSTSVQPRDLAVVGRDEQEKRILETVLRNGSSSSRTNFQVVPIVGMGGIGKTTLARSVYNDNRVLKEFPVRAWFCVTQHSDVFKISKGILDSITSPSCDLKVLNSVQLQLIERIRNKKFLVVLDDLWSLGSSDWGKLRSPFTYGAPGSTIIVTTRIKKVASIMGPTPYELPPLSDAACWSIFKQHILLQERNARVYGNLEVVHDKVVEWCKGLPLAAQTLGGLLCQKERDEWTGILNSKLRYLPDDRDILPVLKLSYQHLPPHLKRCFAYCAIFPEDYEFDERELVLLWMADGFIPESKSKKQMENCGRDYFQDLLSRSFFQPPKNDSVSKYTMHDCLRDLAQWVSKGTSFRLETGSEIQKEKVRRVRHSSVFCDEHDGRKSIEILSDARLSTALLFSSIDLVLLPKLKRLRVLSLKGCVDITELPDSFGGLKHLRSLILAGTEIRCLPESTCSLYNLEILDLKDCAYLNRLPSKMENLINLWYLDIRGVAAATEMPLEVKYLKNVKSLHELYISNLHAGFKKEVVLGEMKNLKVLKLALVDDQCLEAIQMLQPHTNLEELNWEGYTGVYFPPWMRTLEKLDHLKIKYCSTLECFWEDDMSLRRPPEGLSSFTFLRRLEISVCRVLTSLPKGIEYAPLEHLEITGCYSLRFVFRDKLSSSLKHITIRDCKQLMYLLHDKEEASTSSCIQEENVNGSVTLLLEYLSVEDCPSLTFLSSSGKTFQCDAIIDLEVWRCNALTKLIPEGQLPKALERLTIFDCQYLESIADRVHRYTPLESIEITYCPRLKALPNGIHNVNSLEHFTIRNCPSIRFNQEEGLPTNLTELVIGSGHLRTYEPLIKWGFHKLTSLKKLEIVRWEDAVSFPVEEMSKTSDELTSLRRLESLGITESIPIEMSMTLSSSLIELNIANCWNLEYLSSRGFGKLTSLESLRIYQCPNLAFFPEEGLPSSLQRLTVLYCPLLERNCRKDEGREWQKMAKIPNVKFVS